MLLGPVFRSELLRTARRRRYYVARLIYGIVLLFIVWIGYAAATAVTSTLTIDQTAKFAEGTFLGFAVTQLITILLLIPALFGGSIADEKQRKTLHYLMASRLSSFEIVIDKVLGRVPHLAVFLAIGLPVVALLGLFGGVSLDYVAIAYVGTLSTASFTVALTVLVSTLARQVRQSILIAYVLMLAWLFVPVFLLFVGSRLYPATYAWIEPAVTWVGATSPLTVYASVTIRRGWVGSMPSWVIEEFLWMVGSQMIGAVLLVLLAVWRLRPTFRRQAEARPRRGWLGRSRGREPRARRRFWERPSCGEDAMGWKERYFAQTDLFTRLVVLPATVMISVVLVLWVGIDESLVRAFGDLRRGGLWGGGNQGEVFVEHLRVFSAWYVGLWLLAVAGSSASSVAIEREEDTWISLTSTPLTAREIVRGKVLGVLWTHRGFAAVPLGFWTIGLITGAIHPLGFLATLLMFGLATWLVVSVGIHASIRATSTSRALVSAITALACLYGYPLFFYWSMLGYGVENLFVTYLGLPPRLVVGPLVSYSHVAETWSKWNGSGLMYVKHILTIVPGLILAAFYALVAGVVTLRVFLRFDAWLDRPRLSTEVSMPPTSTRAVEPALQS